MREALTTQIHARERAMGLVSLVECTDFVSSETPYGTIYDPVLVRASAGCVSFRQAAMRREAIRL